ADGRAAQYPHALFGSQCINRYGTIAVVGRRWGLHAGGARTFSFGPATDTPREANFHALLAQATGMYFSKPEWVFGDVWERVARIYEKFGHPDEWQKADQAEVTGYQAVEAPIVPESSFKLKEQTPLFWHP